MWLGCTYCVPVTCECVHARCSNTTVHRPYTGSLADDFLMVKRWLTNSSMVAKAAKFHFCPAAGILTRAKKSISSSFRDLQINVVRVVSVSATGMLQLII